MAHTRAHLLGVMNTKSCPAFKSGLLKLTVVLGFTFMQLFAAGSVIDTRSASVVAGESVIVPIGRQQYDWCLAKPLLLNAATRFMVSILSVKIRKSRFSGRTAYRFVGGCCDGNP